MNILRSLIFYVVFYGITVFVLVLSSAVLLFRPQRFRKIPDAWSAFHRWCVNHLLAIEVIEQGNRPEGPCLYAFKHESFFEAIDLPTSMRHPVIFAKDALFKIPLWGRAAHSYGLVPVARKDGAKALRFMISQARSFAKSGRPLIIFPEGTRVPHGERPRLQSGFAGLYKMLGLPVVPVAVNSGPLYHRTWKRRGTITLLFGETIPPGLPRAEMEARVHEAINALND